MAKILIADNYLICDTLSRILHGAGYDVVIAPTHEEAVRLLPEVKPGLVMTNPPFDVLEAVKKYNDAIPVIVMTADPRIETQMKATKAGAAAFVAKPFLVEELLPEIERLLNRHSQRTDVR